MVSKSILLVAAAAVASAFYVDPNTADGVYTVDADGSHTQVSNKTVDARSVAGYARGDSSVYVRRGLGTRDAGCTEGSTDPICLALVEKCDANAWDPTKTGDVDQANSLLATQLNNRIQATPGRPHVYSVSGGAVAYFCILPGNAAAQGDSGSQKRALDLISARCGMYHPGDLVMTSGWKGTGGWAYGWGHVGQNFCKY